MPIISKVGRKAGSVRLLTCLLYLLLIVGGVTMLYPFLLMIATSLTDQVDFDEYRLVPRYFYDEEAKFAKFISAKYARTDAYRALHPADINTFRQVGMPTYDNDPNPATTPRIDVRTGQDTPPRVHLGGTWEHVEARVDAWRAFQRTLPPIAFATWHIGIRNTPGKTETLWRKHLEGIYDTIGEVNRDLNKDLVAFTETFAPYEKPDGRLWPGVEGVEGRVWEAFKQDLDPRYRHPVDGTVLFQKRLRYMRHKIAEANKAFGTNYKDFRDIPLPARLPANDALALEWYQFVRSELPYRFVHFIDRDDGHRRYRAWLVTEFGDVDNINTSLRTAYASLDDITWPPERPTKPELDQVSIFLHGVNEDLNYRQYIRETYKTVEGVNKAFRDEYLYIESTPWPPLLSIVFNVVKRQFGRKYLSIETMPWPPLAPTEGELKAVGEFLRTRSHIRRLEVEPPERAYTRFLDAKFHDVAALNAAFGTSYASIDEVRPPYDEEDLWEFRQDRGDWMKWFLTRNYIDVVDYVAIRGRALWNTVILLAAMIFCALTVNPLAAYALSRFQLGYTNSVLLFVLATMAFPYEVAMIPNFLLMRRFPLWTWLVGLVVGGAVALIVLRKTTGRRKWIAIPIGFGTAVVAGLYLTPLIGKHVFGVEAVGSISLLNTFAALILPRMANGYAIFLLKGFFDSLPEELFEAGKIDGASELRMFWQVAFPLSKPIFAVMALQTFTAIYGSYIWALVVCQSDKMWTLMVYIFQLQQFAPQYVTMAATVLASIPTLLVFIFAQKTIMRGIIIPAYK